MKVRVLFENITERNPDKKKLMEGTAWYQRYPPVHDVPKGCNAVAPFSRCWVCTLAYGHTGPHVGHGGHPYIAVWDEGCGREETEVEG